jgi:predicted dehydrogenase
MRLGLIGSTGHWQTYAPALEHVPDLKLVAVSTSGPEETLGAFDHAPGLTADTRRHDSPQKLLQAERLDVVQVCARCDRIPSLITLCLDRGLPVMAEKPLAMDLRTLERIYQLARRTRTALVPMHTMRSVPALSAVHDSVREGTIGQPLLSFSQKSYKWGNDRADYYRRRDTFPGIAPWMGIHAFDWLHWILGDVFTSVQGVQGTSARPDYPACASQAAFILTMQNGGFASVTLDYLRPDTAPTHGDERLRIAGTRGVIETALVKREVTLIVGGQPPRTLRLVPRPDLFTRFARSLRGREPAPMALEEACRITEIALKAQQAADSGQVASLRDSPFNA